VRLVGGGALREPIPERGRRLEDQPHAVVPDHAGALRGRRLGPQPGREPGHSRVAATAAGCAPESGLRQLAGNLPATLPLPQSGGQLPARGYRRGRAAMSHSARSVPTSMALTQAAASPRGTRRMRLALAAVLLPLGLFTLSGALAQTAVSPLAPGGGLEEELAQLSLEAARLEAELARLEDENAIEILQRSYGYYIDKNLWTQAAELFSEAARLEIGGSGQYLGRASILRYFQSLGAEGPQEGILNDHMQLQPVIHVHADGRAQGRWHHFSQE